MAFGEFTDAVRDVLFEVEAFFFHAEEVGVAHGGSSIVEYFEDGQSHGVHVHHFEVVEFFD